MEFVFARYPEKTINDVNGASGYSRPRRFEESDGVDMRRPSDTVTFAYTPVSVRQMQMVSAFIRRRDRRSREKSQITGCGRFTGTIEMWVMQPKEQKFVYIRKEAVR
ncbi:uncharacterized protein LOC112453910 [Temnothorax curvispinosus]|uniref:Uncharacterized protein LOC112453910 n=1 Tax=Temnothorax curvispinosus TaxID=300111 RepID=A0A6J1PMZ5_9HYME|nr:uncharacterized protein LOC112453910 [Temnothorax curvispinosus]